MHIRGTSIDSTKTLNLTTQVLTCALQSLLPLPAYMPSINLTSARSPECRQTTHAAQHSTSAPHDTSPPALPSCAPEPPIPPAAYNESQPQPASSLSFAATARTQDRREPTRRPRRHLHLRLSPLTMYLSRTAWKKKLHLKTWPVLTDSQASRAKYLAPMTP